MQLSSDLPSAPYSAAQAAATPSPVAEFLKVSKRFGEVLAAEDLNLRIAPGEFLSFLGPSGCGKTTALRMLAGFERPTRGDVLIDGRQANGLEAFQRPVNMVFQNYALFPHLNVADNIAYGLRQRRPRLGRRVIADKVAQALETVRLSGYERRQVWEMSGGQQQRVALARAIINGPKLLLLDEPLAALDRKLRKEMQVELQNLQRRLGITFVMVTHDQEEALSLSDRICVMRAGRIVQIGAPQELYDHPASRYVADFVGTSNFLAGRVESLRDGRAVLAHPGGQRFEGRAAPGIAAGAEGCLSLRPEQIRMARAATDGAHAVTVENRIFLGEHTEYVVRHPGLGLLTVLAPRQSEGAAPPFAAGDPAFIGWDRDAALILAND